MPARRRSRHKQTPNGPAKPLSERLAELQKESQRADSIAEARARLQPGDRVVVPRLGYDRPGRLVKLDPRKKTAVVAIGHVTWNVSIDELIPQAVRPTAQEPSRGGTAGSKSPGPNEPRFRRLAKTNEADLPAPGSLSRLPYQEADGTLRNKTPSGGTLDRQVERPAGVCSGIPRRPLGCPHSSRRRSRNRC